MDELCIIFHNKFLKPIYLVNQCLCVGVLCKLYIELSKKGINTAKAGIPESPNQIKEMKVPLYHHNVCGFISCSFLNTRIQLVIKSPPVSRTPNIFHL